MPITDFSIGNLKFENFSVQKFPKTVFHQNKIVECIVISDTAQQFSLGWDKPTCPSILGQRLNEV